MIRDRLFLLPPGFEANGRREYCPECAEMWGLLHYYPALMHTLDIRYQPLARPRAEMVALLGEDHQNCPTLVLSEHAPGHTVVQTAKGARYIDNARDIGVYFAHRYGVAHPRGR
jgi:uncharacterized membrane protein